jgi:hypothetical protein
MLLSIEDDRERERGARSAMARCRAASVSVAARDDEIPLIESSEVAPIVVESKKNGRAEFRVVFQRTVAGCETTLSPMIDRRVVALVQLVSCPADADRRRHEFALYRAAQTLDRTWQRRPAARGSTPACAPGRSS